MNVVLPAVLDELARPPAPTVLVIEDAHWADGATLDVLRYVCRRVGTLAALVIVTYRDDDLGRDHPLRAVLGGLAGNAATRVQLAPLSLAAVSQLAAASSCDAGTLHRLTGGNPFYVTEALASPQSSTPATVRDAVLFRVRRLGAATQEALDQLSVAPAGIETAVVQQLPGRLAALAEAEGAGVIEVRDGIAAFRHELARQAVVESLPGSLRVELNSRLLRVLAAGPEPDPFRLLHHAVEAGDDAAAVTHGQAAAREASRTGAYQQAASALEQVLQRGELLSLEQRAARNEAFAWALSNSNQLFDAADAAAQAVVLWEQVGDPARLAQALVMLSRQQWLTERTKESRENAVRALELARQTGDTDAHALACVNLGGLLVLLDDEIAGLPWLTEALERGQRVGAPEVVDLAHNYIGSARLQLGDPAGEAELLRALDLALADANHEHVLRAYYNLIEGLWRLGRHDDATRYLDAAQEYARSREFFAHSYMFEARRSRLAAMRGEWAAAEAGLRDLVDQSDAPGMIGRETLPILARLLVRQGRPEAQDLLQRASRHADQADVLEWIVPTGLAWIELAWLSDRPELAGRYPQLLLDATDRPGCALQRGELLRFMQRLGWSAEPFEGCPQPYAAGIVGDWQTAADGWLQRRNPYERALELLESELVEETIEAATELERLGAKPAAILARRRLRALGVHRMPRPRNARTIADPYGLTARQAEILRLIADGLSNADIAARLVVSPRTVDHHVSAILAKLGVHTRREAAALISAEAR
jgi:DNA-binding CsgD family transcriptional regulator/tetratricopeptide (TPR) repeat protein